MLIRSVAEGDLEQVLALLHAKAAFDGCPTAMVATVDSLRTALFAPTPIAHALVAVTGAHVVGIATYYATFSTFLSRPGIWLDDLYVEEASRGQHIGRHLVARLSEIAVERGCARIDWHVLETNERGRAFYESIGARIHSSERLMRLSDDAISALAAT